MSENFTGLFPTPKANGNRNSRKAIIGGHPKHPGKSDLSLEQAVEVSMGILPREVIHESELPPRFRAALTPTASNQLTLFAEAFPVSRTPWLVDVADLPMNATSGLSSRDSFASLNPDGSWRKTCQGYSQVTLDGSLARFSETWPRAGMTRNGIAYQRQPSAPLTDATESGSWPTPRHQVGGWPSVSMEAVLRSIDKNGYKSRLEELVALRQWPTPTSNDHVGAGYQKGKHGARFFTLPGAARESSGQPYDKAASGQLNPTFVEWLMGYPRDWTAT